MKTTPVSTNRIQLSLGRSAFLLIPVALACFALSPQARAVCQEGCLTNENTVLGDNALLNNIGDENTAIGWFALFSNSTGVANTATGVQALSSNTTGYFNTANGWAALLSNATGYDNTANGASALFSNLTGYDNTANGWAALFSNTTGNSNTASGSAALVNNTTGNSNVAEGEHALHDNTDGNSNTAIGVDALLNNNGHSNIALGDRAGSNLTTGNNNIDIGNAGLAGESNGIRIGTKGTHRHTAIAGISGVTVAGGVGVIVGANGQLGTVVSSERFKDNIQPMDKASEAILALRPVTFRYKHDLDPDGVPQFGLVAEDVEKVNPALVARDDQGKVYTVRYEAVNAMLLNEFLKEHRKVEKLEATVAQQNKDFETVVAELKAQIQKVSAQLELSKAAPQMVLNNQ